MYSSNDISIIVRGAPGAGKSNFCNFMIDGYASGRYKTSSACVGGVTKTIRSEINFALNNNANKKVRVIDMPGFGDPDLSMVDFANELKKKFVSGNKIDICLIVTKSTDYRMQLQEILAMKAMKEFLLNINPRSVYCLVTHVDILKLD